MRVSMDLSTSRCYSQAFHVLGEAGAWRPRGVLSRSPLGNVNKNVLSLYSASLSSLLFTCLFPLPFDQRFDADGKPDDIKSKM